VAALKRDDLDTGEHPPDPDPVRQARIWQARLVQMAIRGRGSPAQKLAGALLAEHGPEARRVLIEGGLVDDVRRRADRLLGDAGLTPWGVSTHHAEQESLL
jgi:hypothetical protein